MGLMLLQLACVALVMLRHGTDAQITGFSKPVTGDTVTTGVTEGMSTTATVVIADATMGDMPLVNVVADGSSAGIKTYALTDDDFAIDASGSVKTKTGSTVNYDTKSSYTLTITATDSGDSGATTATLVLNVTVNDLPTFTSPTLCWEIARNAAVGTTVATYTASAGEVGTNITAYNIKAGDTNRDFSETLKNGVLVTAKTLVNATYTLAITATDDGAAPAATAISVTIRLVEEGATLQECTNGVRGLVGSLIVIITAMTAKFM